MGVAEDHLCSKHCGGKSEKILPKKLSFGHSLDSDVA
jgi:hypothetical protein